MNDLEIRAHSAAAGLRHAVDRFEPITDTSAPARRLRGSRVVIALLGIVAVSIVGAGIVAWQADDKSVRTVDDRPAAGIVSTDVGGYPIAITVDEHGAFVANQRNEVIRLDPRTGAIAARVPTDLPVEHIATDPDLGIWALTRDSKRSALQFLGPVTERPPATVGLDNPGVALAFAAGRVWIGDNAGILWTLDPRTMELDSIASVEGSPLPYSLARVGNRVWFASGRGLHPFDPDRPSVRLPGTPPVVNDRHFVSIASDGHWLWASACTAIRNGFRSYSSRGCVLERRDPVTGALLERFTDRPLAISDGGDGLVVGDNGAVWAITADGPTLLRSTPSGHLERVMTIPPRLRSNGTVEQLRYFGIGSGALWYSVPEAGEIYRIPLP